MIGMFVIMKEIYQKSQKYSYLRAFIIAVYDGSSTAHKNTSI